MELPRQDQEQHLNLIHFLFLLFFQIACGKGRSLTPTKNVVEENCNSVLAAPFLGKGLFYLV